MKYEVIGGNMPALVCSLDAGEEIYCEAGAMSWMDSSLEMKTEGGGVGKVVGRMFTNESLFRNKYVANDAGEIAFASKFPGEIFAIQIEPGKSIIAQKKSYIASTAGVETEVFFQKKLGAGLFGGEGFIMEKFSGSGIVFIELDGARKDYDLAPGEKKIMDTGHLVTMDDTCDIDIQMIKGLKNIVLGGEGLFNTTVTGPGHITIQSMPFTKTVEAISAAMQVAKK